MREDAKAEAQERKRRNARAMRGSLKSKQLAELHIPDIVSPSNASRSPTNFEADAEEDQSVVRGTDMGSSPKGDKDQNSKNGNVVEAGQEVRLNFKTDE